MADFLYKMGEFHGKAWEENDTRLFLSRDNGIILLHICVYDT